MRNLLFPTLALGLIGLASCTETDLSVHSGDAADTGGTEMRVGAGTAPRTRTPFDGDQITTDRPLIANVIAFNQKAGDDTQGDYTSVYNNGTMVFNDNTTAFGYTVPKFYPGNKPVFLVGFHPNNAAGTDATPDIWTHDATAGTAAAAISGKADLMATKPVRTTKNEAKAGQYQTITFDHMLTKIIVKIKGVPDRWGKVTDIALYAAGADKTAGLKNICTVSPEPLYGPSTQFDKTNPVFSADATNTTVPQLFVASSSTQTTQQPDPNDSTQTIDVTTETFSYTDTPYTGDGDREISADPYTVAYGMFQPIQADQENYYIKVKTEKGKENQLDQPDERILKVSQLLTADATPQQFLDYSMGWQFIITIDFSMAEIKAYATVVKWNEGGTSEINIEGNMVSTNVSSGGSAIDPFTGNQGTE